MGISVFGIERVKCVQHPENLDETYTNTGLTTKNVRRR